MLGIIIAMEKEAEPFLRNRDVREETWGNCRFYLFDFCGMETVLSVCGIGKVNASFACATMLNRYAIDTVLNFGVSGGLAQHAILDLVVSTQCVQSDVDTSPLGDPRGLVSTVNTVYFPCDKTLCDKAVALLQAKSGTLASGEQFLADNAKMQEIKDLFGASAYDMESGAIAQCCLLGNVKFLSVRCISDSADGTAGADFITFLADASEKLCAAAQTLAKIMSKSETQD